MEKVLKFDNLQIHYFLNYLKYYAMQSTKSADTIVISKDEQLTMNY